MNYDLQGKAPAIPVGSTVLVTGISGYIGSHVADQLLQAGYRVRGTVRDETKGKWVRELFAGKYGEDQIETVIVADMAQPGAFDEACKGVTGVAHVASDMNDSPDPNKVIPAVVAGAINALSAASKEPSIKRFVFTSSSTAILIPTLNEEFTITTSQWNDAAVSAAWEPPPYDPDRAFTVYAASKTQAERESWNFVRDHKPNFVLNAVLPNFNMGTILSDQHSASTGAAVKQIYQTGQVEELARRYGPQWMVDVQDTARLHVAALVDPEVENQRVLAFAHPFNMNDVLACLRRLEPGKEFPEDVEGLGRDRSKLDNSPGAEMLRKFGREGWTNMEDSVKDNIAGYKEPFAGKLIL
ncbi:MAG: hypothetical protein Q9221_001043 [Calogaya cf. arnoldii]